MKAIPGSFSFEWLRRFYQLPSYAMVKQKVPLPDRDALEPALERLQRAFAEEQIDDSDGVRIDLDQGWVHLRPSNTEPIARLIAEASDRQGASELAQRVARAAGLAC
mgnify:CR=1 FL=1